jgi:hypothetical protein
MVDVTPRPEPVQFERGAGYKIPVEASFGDVRLPCRPLVHGDVQLPDGVDGCLHKDLVTGKDRRIAIDAGRSRHVAPSRRRRSR